MLERGTCATQLVVPVEVDTALAYLPVKKEGQNLDAVKHWKDTRSSQVANANFLHCSVKHFDAIQLHC